MLIRRLGLVAAVAAAALCCGALVVLLLPLRANGVHGSALQPRFDRYFGVQVSEPLPADPSLDDFRHAGVQLPQDVVAHRRHIAYALLGGGTASGGLAIALIVIGRRRLDSR